ncbi:MAG: hypothetical protein IPP88_14185 [Betaproteobacteria bacterium]|nr:hypothetical protein [Betaproteobacteria bacterium]
MEQRLQWLLGVALLLGACAQPGTGMYRPDLNDDVVARVSPGQSGMEVSALLGTPYRQIRFDNLKATAWDYRFRDTWGYWVDLSVMMGDDGRVANKVLVRIEPPDKD